MKEFQAGSGCIHGALIPERLHGLHDNTLSAEGPFLAQKAQRRKDDDPGKTRRNSEII